MKNFIISLLLLTILLIGCSNNSDIIEDLNHQIDEKESEIESLIKDNDLVLNQAIKVLELLKEQDWIAVSDYVHPEKGVRLSPYQNVDINKDLVFTEGQIHSILASSLIYSWGTYDGTGDLIELHFSAYYYKFIYDEEFINATVIGNNKVVSYGNTINNIKEIYKDGYFIEFYFSEIDPQYGGLDWRSLTLVFEECEGIWYLVGIIHGEWTI